MAKHLARIKPHAPKGVTAKLTRKAAPKLHLVRQHHAEGGRPLREQKNLYVRFPSVKLYEAVKRAAKVRNMSLNKLIIESLETRLELGTPAQAAVV